MWTWGTMWIGNWLTWGVHGHGLLGGKEAHGRGVQGGQRTCPENSTTENTNKRKEEETDKQRCFKQKKSESPAKQLRNITEGNP